MIRIVRLSALLAIVLVLVSSGRAQSLDGVWRSQGYGYVFEIQGQALKAFELTTTTCVPGFIARRETANTADREASFRTRDGKVFFIRAGGPSDHKLLHIDGSASDIRIDRLSRMPAVCDQPTPNTPLDNFEVFTRTWAEHYISFDIKHTNWNEIVATNRPKVTSKTTPAQLFVIFEAMVKPFGDAHTFIGAPTLKRRFEGLRPGTDRVVKGGFNTFRANGLRVLFEVTERNHLMGPLRRFCNDQIYYGHLDKTTGYLRILSFSGYSKRHDFDAGRAALDAALDEIFSDPALRGTRHRCAG